MFRQKAENPEKTEKQPFRARVPWNAENGLDGIWTRDT